MEHKGRNWRCKYLTKDEFNEFKNNEFYHFRRNAYACFVGIWATVVAAAIIGFVLS